MSKNNYSNGMVLIGEIDASYPGIVGLETMDIANKINELIVLTNKQTEWIGFLLEENRNAKNTPA